MPLDSLPSYTVKELNSAIGNLVERAFPPLFLVSASVSKSQLRKGHLWITLSDGQASIESVVWASTLKKIDYIPKESEGVLIVGKLNFWENRAKLLVQVIDIKPALSTVLRQFEIIRNRLTLEGLINEDKKKPLPSFPKSIGVLTSSPSSALADILRVSKEQWPLTRLIIFPIPVQGNLVNKIRSTLIDLVKCANELSIEAIVLARGGGNREDLMIFDDENLCRDLAQIPIPIVTGIGHEDDLTIADLVSDYRASTPTAAILSLLPNKNEQINNCYQSYMRISEQCLWEIKTKRQKLEDIKNLFSNQNPRDTLKRYKDEISEKNQLLEALSPEKWLQRGFSVLRNSEYELIKNVTKIKNNDKLNIELVDGFVDLEATNIHQK